MLCDACEHARFPGTDNKERRHGTQAKPQRKETDSRGNRGGSSDVNTDASKAYRNQLGDCHTAPGGVSESDLRTVDGSAANSDTHRGS
jgi:hypothetical protein